MTYEQLMREPQHLLLKCISGSNAYNLNIPGSDTDYKGIFVLPQQELYGMQYTPQVANETNDEVYFEIGRFMELLCKNNPNILELLSTGGANTLFRHPLMDLIRPEDYLSRLCFDTFAGYAKTQISKARGLNKKINKPVAKERMGVLNFCYVLDGNGSLPLTEWLQTNNLRQQDCGLTCLDHFRDTYLLFHGHDIPLKGIVSGESADDVQLTSIPKGIRHRAVMTFNKDGYSVYCREYKEYGIWLEKRNEMRYQATMDHGKQYDAKHMMHTMRLLQMAEEIGKGQGVIVFRHDRDFLLGIRSGKYEFEELMAMVEEKMKTLEGVYAATALPAQPDEQKAEDVLRKIRTAFYAHA
ncbi:DNA polymerase beta superfamily protein [Chitinophaga barathri]|uniref:Nucleotidyltransferase n=1 Tax=Chitinophaga barathri TaxID=1647451 RepID=A0A3N4MA03_9BACT|nr:nucleotidyltransferase domain-containing protein [Chitinophaga barathri]RPD40562.1 nucleotidyltransferase [Chitinophaga barathri]